MRANEIESIALNARDVVGFRDTAHRDAVIARAWPQVCACWNHADLPGSVLRASAARLLR
jgi:hypothetical protein